MTLSNEVRALVKTETTRMEYVDVSPRANCTLILHNGMIVDAVVYGPDYYIPGVDSHTLREAQDQAYRKLTTHYEFYLRQTGQWT